MSSSSKNSNFKTKYLDISQDPFIFIVNGQEYKCNIFGVNVSNVIRQLRNKDPSIRKYEYFCDNDNNAFQDICNIFNFKKVQITIKNMRSLQQISEDLQIDVLLDDINKFIDSYDSSLQESEVMDEIFNWLYQIESLTVETVRYSIVNSIWSHTEENIHELAAAILQVIRTRHKLHPLLLELLTSLHQSTENENDLHLLLPFIVNHLLFSFHKSALYCSFIYQLTRIGQISIEKVINRIYSIDRFLTHSNQIKQNEYDEPFITLSHSNVMIWFFPELLKSKQKIEIDPILDDLSENESNFIKFYSSSDNIDNFKKMRDSGEPIDEITSSILHDDVDKLQQIVTNGNIIINKETVPLNIFDVFDRSIEKSFINFACECGSIKVFKYLLLNHAKFDDLSLGFAIFGGNTEIIRIVDQKISNKNNDGFITRKKNNNALYSFYKQSNYLNCYQNQGINYSLDINCVINPIIPSIITHNDDLLSWICDQQYENRRINNLDTDVLVSMAAQNGNSNSFVKFIDRRLFSSFSYKKLIELILLAAKSGFYRLILFLFKVNNINDDIVITSMQGNLELSSIYFGNLSIFKLLINSMQSNCNFPNLLEFAIQRKYLNIIEYTFNKFYVPEEIKIILNMYRNSTSLDSAIVFDFLESKISLSDLKYNFNVKNNDFHSMLDNSIKSNNFECIQKITDFILKEYPCSDFSDNLINSAKLKNERICQFFIDKKVFLKGVKILQNYQLFSFGTEKFIQNLIDYFDLDTKENISKLLLKNSIQTGNKKIVNLLINKDLLNKESSLFDAVKNNDIEIVNKVLQFNDKPSFVNQISKEGTALTIAVFNNSIEIVQRLLKVNKINVNLYDQINGETPLTLAVSMNYIEIAKMLIEYPNTDINMKNNKFKSPLIIAVNNKLDEIVSLLIKNEKFDHEESNLDYAFYISEGNISKQLISVDGIDVNYKNESDLFDSTLNHSLNMNDLEKIELIISHKSFNPIKSQVNELIFSDFSVQNENFFLKNFDKLIKDVNINLNGKSFFVFCSENHAYEILKEIMKSDTFNPNKNDFNNVFIYFLSNLKDGNHENIIKDMIDYDVNHYRLIDFNTSVLYLAARIQNEEIMSLIQKVYEDTQKVGENVKFIAYPSLDKPGIICQLKSMETSPFDPLFVASQSSADIFNLVDFRKGDSVSLYCNEKCFIEFEFDEQFSIDGIYLMYENQDFISLFDIFIDDNKIEANIENLEDDEITINFEPTVCKKLTFRIKKSIGNSLKNDYILLNGIELFSTDEKYSKGVFATLIENNEFNDPHKCKFIISSSDYDFSSFYLVNTYRDISTFDEKDSWFQIEFTQGLAVLNGFRLKRSKFNKLKEFKVVSTNDANDPIENWTTLFEFNETTKSEMKNFDIFQFEQPSQPTKFIRIIQTEPNWEYNSHLILIHVDFFGSYL